MNRKRTRRICRYCSALIIQSNITEGWKEPTASSSSCAKNFSRGVHQPLNHPARADERALIAQLGGDVSDANKPIPRQLRSYGLESENAVGQ